MTDDERKTEAAMFILNRRRARVFYDMFGKFEEQSLTLCFDMMQNLVLQEHQWVKHIIHDSCTCMSSV